MAPINWYRIGYKAGLLGLPMAPQIWNTTLARIAYAHGHSVGSKEREKVNNGNS